MRCGTIDQSIFPIESVSEALLMRQPLEDSDILNLQELFLSKGFHSIKVKNVVEGRSIIETFLSTLMTYHDIACLSVESSVLPTTFTDLYAQLAEYGYLDPYKSDYLDEYFIESFYFDFMWIEATEQLQAMDWFELVIKKIIDFKINQHIPIIVVSYEL